MFEQYADYLSSDALEALRTALQEPLWPGVRLNTLKTSDTRQQITQYAARFGWQTEPVPFCASGWQLAHYEVSPGQTVPHRMGMFYIQDAASMIPAEMFSKKVEQPLILDMAAAPGGKATHLVSHFADRASIIANDSSKKRITALRANLQSWGAMGVMTTNYPGEKLGMWFPEEFDAVLLDAPCSGDTLREEKGRKKRDVSDKERRSLSQRQLALLTSACHAVRVGGEIVYSTCTLNPGENESVLTALLQDYPLEIEAVDGFPHTGLETEGFHPSVVNATRLWPHLFRTSGFFAVRLRKIDHVASPEHNEAPFSNVILKIVRNKDRTSMLKPLLDDYGFDFEAIIDDFNLSLIQKDDMIHAVSSRLLSDFGDLPAMSMGLLAGQLVQGRFVPSHELVSRFWDQFTARRFLLDDQTQQHVWLDGRDLRRDTSAHLSGNVLVLENEHGEFIGRGKVQQGRIRNLLPKRVV